MRINTLSLTLLLSLLLLPLSAGAQTMADYTCYPIFTGSAVRPNILILLDNAANMNLMAYGYDDQGYYHPNTYNPAVTYTGYFNPRVKYIYGRLHPEDIEAYTAVKDPVCDIIFAAAEAWAASAKWAPDPSDA